MSRMTVLSQKWPALFIERAQRGRMLTPVRRRRCLMDDKSRIRLDIPDPEDFDLGSPHVYVPVPSEIVGGLIDLLVCFLDHYRAEEGSEKDYQVWDRLPTSAAQALAGLLS